MNESPIVITGTGAVCGAGLTVNAIWDSILSGKSAIHRIQSWEPSHWPTHLAAEVTADNKTLVADRKLHKMISRTDLFGLYAADQAVLQSGLTAHRDTLDESNAARFNDRCGVFAGSGGGAYRSNYDFFPLYTTAAGDLQKFGQELSNTVNPMWLLKHLPNNVLCHVGIRHNFKGTNACITNQCVGGILAVAEAAAALEAGEADRAIAIGHDAPIEPESVLHYYRLGLMSPDALRPFDQERSGTVFGEGAAAIVLETASDASARQAIVRGEFLGCGCATEALGMLDVRADGNGVERAIELALANAGVGREDIGMIVAHGNGTPASDASEAKAIRRVFKNNPPPVTAFKWAFGHLIAGSGILDAVIALKSLQEQIVPGIPTLETLDPNIAPFPVSATPQKPRSNIALILCRGFGSMNVALVLRGAARSAG